MSQYARIKELAARWRAQDGANAADLDELCERVLCLEDDADALIGSLQADLQGEMRRANLLSKRVDELEQESVTQRKRAEKAEEALRRKAR